MKSTIFSVSINATFMIFTRTISEVKNCLAVIVKEDVDLPDVSVSLPFCVFIVYKRLNGDVMLAR